MVAVLISSLINLKLANRISRDCTFNLYQLRNDDWLTFSRLLELGSTIFLLFSFLEVSGKEKSLYCVDLFDIVWFMYLVHLRNF